MGKGGRLFGYSGGTKSHKETYEPMYQEGLRDVRAEEYSKAETKETFLSNQNSTVARRYAAKLRIAIEEAQKAQEKKE